MIIFWKGKGWLVPIIIFGCSLFMEVISESVAGDSNYYQESKYMLMFALLLASAVILVLDKFILKSEEHTFMFLDIRYWTFIIALLGLGSFLFK